MVVTSEALGCKDKDLGDIPVSSSPTPTGAPNARGVVNIYDFRQITHYISKMFRPARQIHSFCACSTRMMTLPMPLSDCNHPESLHFTFLTFLHTSGVAEA